MKKRIFKTVCALILLMSFLLCFCAFSCSRQQRDYREVFKLNWNFELPENMHSAFRASEDNWGHFGIRYAYFEFDEEPTDFLADFDSERNVEMEYTVNYLLIAAKFRIYTEYIPNWDNDYCWKILEKEYHYSETDIVIDKCYLIYFYDKMQLAICQNFI